MLTPRLEMILKHIKGSSVADIGTDHAYIPIELAKDITYRTIIATDLRLGPLKIAHANLCKYGLEHRVELRLGSGILPITPGETDTVIIAGMGGLLVADILAEAMEQAKQAKLLLLQPMNAQAELRKWLCEHQFQIIEEDIAIEGFKVYNLLLVVYGGCNFYQKEIDYHIPDSLLGHRYFDQLAEKKQREFGKIVAGLKHSLQPDAEKLAYYEQLSEELEEKKRRNI